MGLLKPCQKTENGGSALINHSENIISDLMHFFPGKSLLHSFLIFPNLLSHLSILILSWWCSYMPLTELVSFRSCCCSDERHPTEFTHFESLFCAAHELAEYSRQAWKLLLQEHKSWTVWMHPVCTHKTGSWSNPNLFPQAPSETGLKQQKQVGIWPGKNLSCTHDFVSKYGLILLKSLCKLVAYRTEAIIFGDLVVWR